MSEELQPFPRAPDAEKNILGAMLTWPGEVATALECPAQTAYSRLHAARRQVQSFVRRSSQGRWAG